MSALHCIQQAFRVPGTPVLMQILQAAQMAKLSGSSGGQATPDSAVLVQQLKTLHQAISGHSTARVVSNLAAILKGMAQALNTGINSGLDVKSSVQDWSPPNNCASRVVVS
mmetsp:Transcript_54603/g.95465  ORF Transcript_54603/g.95465 Transcript_54603/m.95465 type:complete len:111 (-) Transcript_54603:711-1043(-)